MWIVSSVKVKFGFWLHWCFLNWHYIPEKYRMLWWSLGTNFPMWTRLHCVKRVRIQSCSGSYFSTFGLNTERGLHAFFYRQHFYQQLQAEIWQKLKMSNTLSLNFCYLKIFCFFHPLYHPKIIEDILKMYKNQLRLSYWHYMINDNEYDVENKK